MLEETLIFKEVNRNISLYSVFPCDPVVRAHVGAGHEGRVEGQLRTDRHGGENQLRHPDVIVSLATKSFFSH